MLAHVEHAREASESHHRDYAVRDSYYPGILFSQEPLSRFGFYATR